MPLMNPSRFGPLLLLAVGLTLGLAFGLGDHRAEAQVGTRTITVSGIASVEGQPVLVHILAVVGPNERAGDVAGRRACATRHPAAHFVRLQPDRIRRLE